MFIGHIGLGFAAKRLVPRVSLAMLVAAALFADILWPVFLAVGLEQVRIDPGNTRMVPLDFASYPYSHSLAALIVWGVVVAGIFRLVAGNGHIFPVLIGLVVSHWLLDVVTHRPDMPLYPGGGLKFGLALWNSIPATLAVETTLFVAGVWIYVRGTRAADRVGRWGFAALVLVLAGGYIGNATGAPPPSIRALWMVSLISSAILITWLWRIDRRRQARITSSAR